MDKHQKYILLTILMFFFAVITLGGLGNAAFSVDKFYWFPFVINLGVYGWLVYKLYKKGQEE